MNQIKTTTNKPESDTNNSSNIEKSKQTPEEPLHRKAISKVLNGLGIAFSVLGLLLIMVSLFLLLNGTRSVNIATASDSRAVFGSCIIAGFVCLIASAIIRVINTTMLEMRKIKEEIKLNKK